jgi:hypothetical protein
MKERFLVLSSKPVQISGRRVLCEDGSIWKMVNPGPIVESDGSLFANTDPGATMEFVLLSPPHKPPTQSDEFKEALHWLEVLWHNTYSHEVLSSVLAFLRKHGRCK